MIRNMAKTRALVVCTALIVAACSRDSGGGDAGTASTITKSKTARTTKVGPSREEQTAGMVQAAAALRSADIADLKFDIATRPQAGQPFSVELALLPTTESPLATLDLTGSEGLILSPDDASASFPDVSRSHVYRKSVAMTAATEGVYFLSVLATFKNADFTDSRGFTIPVIVEPARAGGKAGGPSNGPASGKPASASSAVAPAKAGGPPPR